MGRRAVLLILLSIAAAGLAADDRPTLAVLDFRVSSLSEADMRPIVALLSVALFRTGKYAVIDVAQRDTLLREMDFSVADCSDEACQLQVGQLLSAALIAVGDLAKAGSRYVLTVKILETETARTVSAVDGVYLGLDALIDDVQSLAERLTGLPGSGSVGTRTSGEAPPSASGLAADAAPTKLPLLDMVLVEGGTYRMGSRTGDSDESPVHSVTVSSHYLGKYEVTQGQWAAVMGSTPSRFEAEDRPVEQVSWFEAAEFCNRLSVREGIEPAYAISGTSVSCDFSKNGYRLPTEAEWEYAARGGTRAQGYTYAGGNDAGAAGWYADNAGSSTHPVGGKQPNELGLYDMSGNVWEWCWDWYGSYSGGAQTDPRGPSSGQYRLLRGGSWNFVPASLRVTNRNWDDPANRSAAVGFRLARSAR